MNYLLIQTGIFAYHLAGLTETSYHKSMLSLRLSLRLSLLPYDHHYHKADSAKSYFSPGLYIKNPLSYILDLIKCVKIPKLLNCLAKHFMLMQLIWACWNTSMNLLMTHNFGDHVVTALRRSYRTTWLLWLYYYNTGYICT